MKTGRNQSCPCGSGEKFKHCHGGIGRGAINDTTRAMAPSQQELQRKYQRLQAASRIREEQQGLGRPIIATKVGDHQVVAVNNTLHWAKWKTFPDFLAAYIKDVLGSAWGDAEIAKPIGERHVILQWYDDLCAYQREWIKVPDEIHSSPINGVVGCYLGLAYSLYLLAHNIELQTRLVNRLKDPGQFAGAYYELIVANTLIRAGFDLTLEDETDGDTKHCEFAAVSKTTHKKYWVEAKMRAVAGLLGKTTSDGGKDQNPLSQLVPHLNQALAKPAADNRLIFIDVNAEPHQGDLPEWGERAAQRLERYERDALAAGTTAYVFVTNFPFHRALRKTLTTAVLPFGLGMFDFNRPGLVRVSDAYREKQRHIDAHNIGNALAKYPRLPSTFDGGLASEVYGTKKRLQIGERHFFDSIGETGATAEVSTATVVESEKAVYFGVSDDDGKAHILRETMTDSELADYKTHPTAYFGRIVPKNSVVTTPFEFFERLMENHKDWTREQLLARVASIPNFDVPATISTDDLRAAYCELLVSVSVAKGPKSAEQ